MDTQNGNRRTVDMGNASSNGISVVITVLNEKSSITKLLNALADQSLPPDEIVVVDGGSTDGTVTALEDFSAKDKRLRWYVEPGVNISQGRNSAIARATHNLIAVTDGGCLPERDWLRELTKPLLESQNLDAVAGEIEIEWHTNFEFFSGLLCQPKDQENESSRLFFGRSSAFRRHLWERAGGYPEWLYTAEDTLFALKAKSLGCRIGYAPKSVVKWRPRPTLKSLAKMFYLYGKGNGRINQGNMPGTLYWLRNHSIWLACLIAGFFLPWLWLATGGIWLWLYITMINPVLHETRKKTDNLWREIYVPLIVMTRNISVNLGYLYGNWEYRNKSMFMDKLNDYLS